MATSTPIMITQHNQIIPTKISFGERHIDEINFPDGNVLLVISKSVPQWIIDIAVQKNKISRKETFIITKSNGEPTSDEINSAFQSLKNRVSSVLGIGGGSTLDFAKAMAILLENGGEINDFEFGDREIANILPIYTIPTTCGSGSEVTPYAVINNSKTGRKFTLKHSYLFPTHSIIEPRLLTNLPKDSRIASSLDAFIHCLEAYLNRRDNSQISSLATEGLKLGWETIPRALSDSISYATNKKLAALSLYGGMSISKSRTGLIHTLSVAFSSISDHPHGLLNALLLPHVVKYNINYYNGLMAEIMSEITGTKVLRDFDGMNLLNNYIENITQGIKICSTELINIKAESLMNRVMQDTGLIDINPARVDSDSILELIGEIADAQR